MSAESTARWRRENPERAKEAYRKAARDRYACRYARINAFKLEAGCADCGFHADACALQFDHLPQYAKTAAVATMIANNRSMVSIVAEMAKCEVVCANCHAVRTRDRRLH